MHMKVVTAARAAGQGGKEGEGEGEKEPEADDAEGDVQRRTEQHRQLQQWQIDEDRSPQVPAPAANQSEAIGQLDWGRRRFCVHDTSKVNTARYPRIVKNFTYSCRDGKR